MGGGDIGFQAPHDGCANCNHLLSGTLGLVDGYGGIFRDDKAFGIHPVLGKVLHIYCTEVADTHVHGDECFLNVLENHAVEKFPGEVQACCRSANRALVLCKNCLVVLCVFRGNLFLYPFRHIRFSKAEEGFLEFLVGAVEEETKGSATGSGVVNHLCHKAFILSEVEFVADTDFAGGIHDHVPEALLTVKFPEEEDHDVRAGLFLLAVHTGRKHLCVVEHKDVSFAEIVYDVLEEPVLYLSGVLMEHHEAGFVPPAGGLRCNALLGELEVELRKFHLQLKSILL